MLEFGTFTRQQFENASRRVETFGKCKAICEKLEKMGWSASAKLFKWDMIELVMESPDITEEDVLSTKKELIISLNL